MSPDGSKQPPEERLLRLIRGKAPQAAAAGAPARLAVPARVPAAPVNWAKAAAIVLAVVVVVEAIWVVVQLVRPLPPIVMPPPPAAAQPRDAAPEPEPMPSVAASAVRPLFNAPATGGIGTARQAMSGSAKLLATRLTLTGIMSTEPPQAIIEDTQTQKTYMVMVGQPLAEGAVLEQILDNRVILDFDGEKVELGL